MIEVHASEVGLRLIQSFEGYMKRLPDGSCQAYLDRLVSPSLRSPGFAGLWTIGWGNTGPEITKGTVWSRAKAEAELAKMVERHARAVSNVLMVPVTQNQADALISLSYNMGIGKAKSLLRKLNAGDYDGAADAFLLYNKAGGKVLKGLTRRRHAERALFLSTKRPPSVVQASRKLTVMQRIRQAIAGLGVSAAAVSQFVTDSWQWLKENPQYMALGMLGLSAGVWLILKWVEHASVQDYEEGRYVPTGYDDQ